MMLNELLTWTVEKGASDLHLSAEMPPMVRIDGDLHKLQEEVVSHREVLSLLESVMTSAQFDSFRESHELDFSMAVADVSRFRVNAFMQSRGASAAFRVVPSRVKSLEELAAPAVVALVGEVLADLRQFSNIPVIVLSARTAKPKKSRRSTSGRMTTSASRSIAGNCWRGSRTCCAARARCGSWHGGWWIWCRWPARQAMP